jgi:DNA-directed RNA polymerase subunit RPC12/RpoP
MAVSINCTGSYIDASGKTKKCGVVQPHIDPKTDKVYCPMCNEEIPNVSYFVKATLKTLKQYKPKSTATFNVKCQNCGAEGQPLIVDEEIVCHKCKKEHKHLSGPFKNMLKLELQKANKDVQ